MPPLWETDDLVLLGLDAGLALRLMRVEVHPKAVRLFVCDREQLESAIGLQAINFTMHHACKRSPRCVLATQSSGACSLHLEELT